MRVAATISLYRQRSLTAAASIMRFVAMSSIVVTVGACSSARRVTLQAQDGSTGVPADVRQQDDSSKPAPDAAVTRDLASPDRQVPSDVRVWPDASTLDVMVPDATIPDVTVPDATVPDVMVPDLGPSCVHPPVVADCNNNWCSIQAGCFMMGSPPGDPCTKSPEVQHEVTLTNSFEMHQTEVTQGQFTAVMGYNPSLPCGDNCPVGKVSWHESAAYCNALSLMAGYPQCYTCTGSGPSITCDVAGTYDGTSKTIYDCPGYRLPTEAEWEYAYRAGSSSPLYPGVGNDGGISTCEGSDPNADKIGWYAANSGGTAHPVAQKTPNAWGLFDMAGNAYEWCHDWYRPDYEALPATDPWGNPTGSGTPHGPVRVHRGGSYLCSPYRLRAANRDDPDTATDQDPNGGFRCAKTTGSCGNGVLDANEACDEGPYNSDTPGATCRTDCVLCGSCGNGSEGDFVAAVSTTLAGGVHHFSSFTIQPGATVTVTGPTPLSLYVRGSVDIAGTLTLSGGPGGKGACWYTPAGTAGDGGGGGGAGGGTGGWHDPSLSPDTYAGTQGQGLGGGHAPPAPGNLMVGGGGGGGGYAVAGTPGGAGICCPSRCGDQSDFPGGAGGIPYGAPTLNNKLIGGSGGGGGHHGHADNGSGGGGGGGGGALLIIASSITVSGKILANGGNGGDACMNLDGGAGGGGSGGTIWLRATAVNINGTVSATGGSGGTATGVGGSCGLGGIGGKGSDGRIRVDAVTLQGTTTPAAFEGTSFCRGAPCE